MSGSGSASRNPGQVPITVKCGGVDDTGALNEAITKAKGSWIVITSGQTCVAGDLVIPKLRIDRGGFLNPATSHTVTMSGELDAGPYQIFKNALPGQGNISMAGNTALAEVLPEWWGAVADDKTDCTAAIQAALDAFRNVRIRRGTFRIIGTRNALLNLPAQHNLYGEGPESVIHLTGSATAIQNSNDTSIANLTLRGPSDGKHYVAGEIAIQGNAIVPNPYNRPVNEAEWRGLRSRIQNLIIENWGSNAISIMGNGRGGAQESEVSGCIIRNVGNEGVLAFGDGNKIHDNQISNTLGWGIDIQGSNNQISRNRLVNVSNNVGYYAGEDTGGILLNGNIWPSGCYANVFDHNSIDTGTNPGIVVLGNLNYPVVGTIIKNNVINNMGLKTRADSASIVVADNGTGEAVCQTEISQNEVHNSGVKGIVVWNTVDTVLSANVVDKAVGTGIEVVSHAGAHLKRVTVNDNVVTGLRNSVSGIVILGAEQANLSRNQVSAVIEQPVTVYAGILIGGNTSQYQAVDNTISLERTRGHGFFITNSATRGVLKHNIISDCTVGIYYDSIGDYLDTMDNDLGRGNTTPVVMRGVNKYVSHRNNKGYTP